MGGVALSIRPGSANRGKFLGTLVVSVAWFGLALGSDAAQAAPYRPTSDAEVLERLPTPGDARQRELRRLREENRRLRMEREILKKAARFFASESG